MADITLVKPIKTGADVTALGEVAAADRAVLPGGFKAVYVTETRLAIAAANIDLALANYFDKTITALTTFTVSNVPASGEVASFILELTNGGAFAVTWWAGVKWAGGTAPTLTAAGVDVLGFYTRDAGATWRGMVLAKDSK